MKPTPPAAANPRLCGLYAITQDDPLLPRLSALVSAALEGGVRIVQYRNKSASRALRRAQAAELLRICRAAGARLIINDDVWLAVEIGADGAHVSHADAPGGSFKAVREALGPRRILGVSCHNDLIRGAEAAAAGADYLAFGSVFTSATKPGAPRITLDDLAEAQRRFALPIAAVGGITLKNAAEVLATGADLVAVCSDLFNAMDITSRARNYGKLFARDDVRGTEKTVKPARKSELRPPSPVP